MAKKNQPSAQDRADAVGLADRIAKSEAMILFPPTFMAPEWADRIAARNVIEMAQTHEAAQHMIDCGQIGQDLWQKILIDMRQRHSVPAEGLAQQTAAQA